MSRRDAEISTGGWKRDAWKLCDQEQLSPARAVQGVMDIEEFAYED